MHHEVVWTLNLLSIAVMIGVIAINHGVTYQRTKRREAVECLRLRAALRSELQVLHDAYRLNIELIDRKAEYLISTRGLTAIYKANLARLTVSLGVEALDSTVSLYANNEIVEELLSTHANGKSGLSYKLSSDKDVGELRRLYELGASRTVEARKSLDEPDVQEYAQAETRIAPNFAGAR
jgi:hypothetical protein